jgi:(E)-4-hydroxy-3-methylbut-2-enyl-diphosphate synthase
VCRFAVTLDGTESEEVVKSLASLDPIVALLNTAAGHSRLHTSRRVFNILKANSIETPVLHHRIFEEASVRDEIVITTGSEVGGLLCDGLGDGVLLEVPSEDIVYLRNTSFGLLQVRIIIPFV